MATYGYNLPMTSAGIRELKDNLSRFVPCAVTAIGRRGVFDDIRARDPLERARCRYSIGARRFQCWACAGAIDLVIELLQVRVQLSGLRLDGWFGPLRRRRCGT